MISIDKFDMISVCISVNDAKRILLKDIKYAQHIKDTHPIYRDHEIQTLLVSNDNNDDYDSDPNKDYFNYTGLLRNVTFVSEDILVKILRKSLYTKLYLNDLIKRSASKVKNPKIISKLLEYDSNLIRVIPAGRKTNKYNL
jgi:hypothetical protein